MLVFLRRWDVMGFLKVEREVKREVKREVGGAEKKKDHTVGILGFLTEHSII